MTYPSLPEEIEMFLAFFLRKPKTGDRIAAISRLVPGAGQFSNSLYANLDEFKALKESLKREGIFDETLGNPCNTSSWRLIYPPLPSLNHSS